MHGPLRLTYALLVNYMVKCQMSSGPYGPIFTLLVHFAYLVKLTYLSTFDNVRSYCKVTFVTCCIYNSLCLHGGQWKPISELKHAQSECIQVADILDTTAIVGAEATKKRLLSELQQATVLHIGKTCCIINI